mmetsp:Transcript_77968/g.186930  ORF Transcript_77968/g.186930 Transcript_77968/m.186930 type:complete len:206 (-) Transcript_77968:1475-2092(-)
MQRWSSCILAWIADCVTSHRCLVSCAALPTVHSLLDVLLGVVPCASCCVQEYREKNARSRGKHQEACDRLGSDQLVRAAGSHPEKETNAKRYGGRNHAWGNHFSERRLCHNADARGIVRFLRAIHNARPLFKLQPHVVDDFLGCRAHCRHALATEVEHQGGTRHAPEKDLWLGDVHRINFLTRDFSNLIEEGREQQKASQACGTH